MDVRIEVSSSSYPGLGLEDLNLAYLDSLCLQAFLGDIEVSRLNLHRVNYKHTWVVGNIQTHPDYVRRGLATHLYRTAESMVGHIKHSTMRSIYGDAWARSMGHEVPESPIEALGMVNFELWMKASWNEPHTADQIDHYFDSTARTPEELPVPA